MKRCGPPAWNLVARDRCHLVVAGVRLQAYFDPDEHEIRRRREHSLSPVLDWRQLEALATLPLEVQVPWREVDLGTRVLLDTLPQGAVVTDRQAVRRIWKPAVQLVAVEASATRWPTALHDLGMFASVAPRVLALSKFPSDAERLHARARRLGIGVVVSGSPPSALAAPSGRYVRAEAPAWECAEAAYAAWRARPTGLSTSAAAAS